LESYDAVITGVSKNGKNTILYEITNKLQAKGFEEIKKVL